MVQQYAGIPVFAYGQVHEKVAALLSDLPRGSRVLDVPAGAGALSRRLADAGLQVHAGDLEPEHFRPTDIPCSTLDLNGPLPFAVGEFDAVACVEGIEHLENPFGLVRELGRCLKRGGRLVITTPNITSARSRLRFFLTGHMSLSPRPINEFARDWGNDHITPLTYPQLRYMLHTNGFEVQQVTGAVRQAGGWFALFAPVGKLMYARACGKEPDARQRAVNPEIARVLFSREVLTSRILVVSARKR